MYVLRTLTHRGIHIAPKMKKKPTPGFEPATSHLGMVHTANYTVAPRE